MGAVEWILKLPLYYASLLNNTGVEDLDDVYKFLCCLLLQALIDIAVKAALGM